MEKLVSESRFHGNSLRSLNCLCHPHTFQDQTGDHMDVGEADFNCRVVRRPRRASTCGSSSTGCLAGSPLGKQVKRSSLSLKRPLGCLIKKKNQCSCCRGHLISSF